MRKMTAALVLLLTVMSVTPSWAQNSGIIDPVQPTALQTHLCTLNAGKTMVDLNHALEAWHAAVEESRYNGLTLQLTPRFGNPPADVIWLNYLPFDQLAEAGEWFDANGQEAMEAIFSVVSCRVALSASFARYANGIQNEDGPRFVGWNWCTRLQGVTRAAVRARHQMVLQRMSDADVRGGWAVSSPQLGTRRANRPGDFAHFFFYPDWAALADNLEARANGGWRNYANYEETIASCTGENLYDAVTLNRPHTPWWIE
jgi:hypothetical protein